MSEELQNDSEELGVIYDEPEVTNDEQVEEPEEAAELATASEEQHEENTQDDSVNQDAVQAAINKQHAKYREEERKRKEVEKQLEEYRNKERELEAQKLQSIPPIPDEFDYETTEEYEKAKSDRDALIAQKAIFDHQEALRVQAEQNQLLQQQQEQQQAVQEAYTSYSSKVQELGIDANKMQQAGQLVEQSVSNDMVMAILADEVGPQITLHLAENPDDLAALNNLNPIIAGAKFAEIKQKASVTKKQSTKAPKPATRVEGGGVDPDADKYPLISGAKFE